MKARELLAPTELPVLCVGTLAAQGGDPPSLHALTPALPEERGLHWTPSPRERTGARGWDSYRG